MLKKSVSFVLEGHCRLTSSPARTDLALLIRRAVRLTAAALTNILNILRPHNGAEPRPSVSKESSPRHPSGESGIHHPAQHRCRPKARSERVSEVLKLVQDLIDPQLIREM